MEKIINQRIQSMKTALASNKIEGAIDQTRSLALLERAKAPISNEVFRQRELSRIYQEYGLTYVK
ncbi:hypothetical protein [Volucribacter amazonae]|uniref:hypothetical protein n=1 Tax=Volucribacter amazonae TaxID=256731 RepID=UPI00244370C5|nr:hypothetical protein [Volucribacter amazonae]